MIQQIELTPAVARFLANMVPPDARIVSAAFDGPYELTIGYIMQGQCY